MSWSINSFAGERSRRRIDAMIAEKSSLAGDVVEGGETLLTEMSDDELLDFVRLDVHKALDNLTTHHEKGVFDVVFDFSPTSPWPQRRTRPSARWRRGARRGQAVSPVVIDGRTIARTFWGKAWCDNLESYSDYANRLPRGRTYVRNGSVVDLQIKPGKITALVSGSELYKVEITITALPDPLEQHQEVSAPARSARWWNCCKAGFRRASWIVVTQRDEGSVPEADRDQDVVLLPGLGRHVQACRRRHVRRRSASR